ncbi:MAG: hypothetical protein Q8R28_04595, partial [Dehalococcoidia bacterium]|nr:hypothetical protein [Dehalococcoidia bacterium]
MEILQRAMETEKKRMPGLGISGAWLYHSVGATREDIKRLLDEGLIEVYTKNSLGTKYKLAKKGADLVWAITMETKMETIPAASVMEAFSLIVGFDDLKLELARAIEGQKKANFLLSGPPASAKSMILEGIRSIVPSAYLAFGSRTSSAGLSDALFEFKPKVLLIDEADKVHNDVFSVLLGLMESGEIIETK